MSSPNWEYSSACPVKIGTRGSVLAVWQAMHTMSSLGWNDQAQIVKIVTSGDRYQKGSLADIGGKGLFAKEIDEALLSGKIDIAVHSLKDLETDLPEGLVIGAVLSRDDPRDSFIGSRLADLPSGVKVATCSVRRGAFVRHLRPDIEIVPIRGNVQTRLRKLSEGLAEATLLSYAGLQRLEYEDIATEVFSTSVCVPAVGQGVIVVMIRKDDQHMHEFLQKIHCEKTFLEITAERSMLAVLDGSCHTPIGGFAELKEGSLSLDGVIYSPDGQRVFRHQDTILLPENNARQNALELGKRVGAHIAQHAQAILAEST